VRAHDIALFSFKSKAEPFSCPKQGGDTKDCKDRGRNAMNQPNRHTVSDPVTRKHCWNIDDHHA